MQSLFSYKPEVSLITDRTKPTGIAIQTHPTAKQGLKEGDIQGGQTLHKAVGTSEQTRHTRSYYKWSAATANYSFLPFPSSFSSPKV